MTAPAATERALARYELAVQRRLDRTRLLVRAGPAIGLMGTLDPARPGPGGPRRSGDVASLAENLRDAFGATVVGLLVGTVAFALTLARTRMYTEDLAALEQAVEMRATRSAGSCRPRSGSDPGLEPGSMSRIGLGRHGKIAENAGDPLDGLVNLFDIGIVLAVAFLIAGLTLTVDPDSGQVQRRPSASEAQVRVLPDPTARSRRAAGRGRSAPPTASPTGAW